MDVKDLKKLLDAVAESEVSELTLETGDFKLTLKRGGEPAPQPAGQAAPQSAAQAALPPPATQLETPAAQNVPAPAAAATPAPSAPPSNLAEVKAPIVGTFYEAPTPDSAPFVKLGDRVAAGTVLCIIEAMKLMNEIEAEVAGTLKEILVKNEDPVEYGQALFRIEPG